MIRIEETRQEVRLKTTGQSWRCRMRLAFHFDQRRCNGCQRVSPTYQESLYNGSDADD